jgi:hypothetical protein
MLNTNPRPESDSNENWSNDTKYDTRDLYQRSIALIWINWYRTHCEDQILERKEEKILRFWLGSSGKLDISGYISPSGGSSLFFQVKTWSTCIIIT